MEDFIRQGILNTSSYRACCSARDEAYANTCFLYGDCRRTYDCSVFLPDAAALRLRLSRFASIYWRCYAAHLLFGLNPYVTIVAAGSLLFALIWYFLGKKIPGEAQSKFGFREFIAALEGGARNALSVVAACATAGILTGVVTMTGLGPVLSGMIIDMANNQLFLVLLFTMIACIIMGLGMPTTATYIVLAAVMAPALVQVGIPLLAAHLFVFYYGILADDTPPINLPAYATAGIAKADPIRTGIQGFKFDMGALLLPFAFALNPILILQAENVSFFETAWVVMTAFLGIIAWASFIQSYMFTKYGWIERILAVACAFTLINQELWTDAIGITILLILIVFQWFKNKKKLSLSSKVA